jgi:hypothetical protein
LSIDMPVVTVVSTAVISGPHPAEALLRQDVRFQRHD